VFRGTPARETRGQARSRKRIRVKSSSGRDPSLSPVTPLCHLELTSPPSGRGCYFIHAAIFCFPSRSPFLHGECKIANESRSLSASPKSVHPIRAERAAHFPPEQSVHIECTILGAVRCGRYSASRFISAKKEKKRNSLVLVDAL